MEFRSVGGQKKYFKYAECEAGDVLVQGKYLGRSPNKFGKENFDIKPEEGPTVCLNHAGQLAHLIESNVAVGDLIQVTYLGKEQMPSGPFKGSEVHQFDVAIADDGSQLDAKDVKEFQDKLEKKAEEKSSGTVDLSDLD